MSFKSFSSFNTQLNDLQEQLDRNTLLARIINRVSTIITNAKTVPGNYTTKYNSVQLLEYNSEGKLEDVTPDAQLTIPNSVLEQAQGSIKSNQTLIRSDLDVLETIPVPLKDLDVTPSFSSGALSSDKRILFCSRVGIVVTKDPTFTTVEKGVYATGAYTYGMFKIDTTGTTLSNSSLRASEAGSFDSSALPSQTLGRIRSITPVFDNFMFLEITVGDSPSSTNYVRCFGCLIGDDLSPSLTCTLPQFRIINSSQESGDFMAGKSFTFWSKTTAEIYLKLISVSTSVASVDDLVSVVSPSAGVSGNPTITLDGTASLESYLYPEAKIDTLASSLDH